MSMHKCWSLFNKYDKLRIDDLTVDQVRTILLAIPASRMADWYACREGEVHWQALLDMAEFYEDVHAARGSSYIEPEKPNADAPAAASQTGVARRPLFEDLPADRGTEPTLNIESIQTKERRSARRYNRRLIFRANIPGGKFETSTVDISMGGLSLAQPLPADLNKNFRAELSFNGMNMKVVCSRVSDHQLKLLEAEAWDVLRQWIANW